MENFHVFMAGLTAVILFVYGLENFSKEIERISGEHFRKSLSSATKIPVVGVVIGALVTMVIQSSSATSVITISLVNAGVLSFKNSVGIIFGSNIGTTITAQLVAFKLTDFAPFFIIFGFFLSVAHNRWSIFGKSIFYFGFVFFSLNLISSSLQPLQNNAALIEILTQPQNPFIAILFGCLFTAVVQSSSVTTGLAIIFTQQGLLGLENAVPIIMGANIGTTATALIAVFSMDVAAKKAALCHFLFNVGGVLLFVPVLLLSGDWLSKLETDPAIALANIHLAFNLIASVTFTVFISPFIRFVDYILGEGKMDFTRLSLPVFNQGDEFKQIQQRLEDGLIELFGFLQENYNIVTLSIETNYEGIYLAAEKRLEYINFIKNEYMNYFALIVSSVSDEKESKQLIKLVNQYDYLFQVHDSVCDMFSAKRVINQHFIELKSDVLLTIRELSSETLTYFDDINNMMRGEEHDDIKKKTKSLQHKINMASHDMLVLLADHSRVDASALTNFVTYSQRLKDKLTTFESLRHSLIEGQDATAEKSQ